jgi:hypothetical protein
MKPVGKPDAGNPHVRFDERGGETDRSRDTAPLLDSTVENLAVPSASTSAAEGRVRLVDIVEAPGRFETMTKGPTVRARSCRHSTGAGDTRQSGAIAH